MAAPDHDIRKIDHAACGVITVSDTRTADNDKSGALIIDVLEGAGHRIASREIVRDEPAAIRSCVERMCAQGCEVVILNGGTGIAPRDVTYEAIEPLIEKRLDGFAELFRSLSFAEIGPNAMLSRALAGTRGKTLLFSLPGSPKAVQLAMERLILPVLPHAAALLKS